MLKPAILYADVLKTKLRETWFVDKYKYYNFASYFSDTDVATDNWQYQQFVSVDKDNNVLGYISYQIGRQANFVDEFGIIAFVDNSITFGKDLHQAILDIFFKFNYNKISFQVVIGNPIERYYDKFVENYDGRIVGIKHDECKLYDGNLYDIKLYEVMRCEFVNAYQRKHKNPKS